jgi:hypothetical protein
VQGAIPAILSNTPQEFFDRTVDHVEVFVIFLSNPRPCTLNLLLCAAEKR